MLTVCHLPSIFVRRARGLPVPHRALPPAGCREGRADANGSGASVPAAGADRGSGLPPPLPSGLTARGRYPNDSPFSDKKIVSLRLSKMPVQKNGSPSVLRHGNRVLLAVPDAPLSPFSIVFGFERPPSTPQTRTVNT